MGEKSEKNQIWFFCPKRRKKKKGTYIPSNMDPRPIIKQFYESKKQTNKNMII